MSKGGKEGGRKRKEQKGVEGREGERGKNKRGSKGGKEGGRGVERQTVKKSTIKEKPGRKSIKKRDECKRKIGNEKERAQNQEESSKEMTRQYFFSFRYRTRVLSTASVLILSVVSLVF